MIEIDIQSDKIERALDVLAAFPRKDFMLGLVDLTVRQAQERFDTKRSPEGREWKPWSESYRKRGAPFHSRHTMLHLTGAMMEAIGPGSVSRDQATVEVPVPYAARQNADRQFLGFIDQDPEMVDYAVDYLVRRVEAA